MSATLHETFPRAGFRRRIASWLYDGLVAIAVYMTAGAASFLIISLFVHFRVFDLQGYQHLSDTISNTAWLLWPNELWKLAWVAFFFVWFWSKSGQTLGMRAWKLKLVGENHIRITWAQAFFRFCYALISWIPFGAGFLWIIIDKKKQAWHDKVSRTYIADLK